ncbi:hypothetical protein [Streptomyces sp. NPDC046909]
MSTTATLDAVENLVDGTWEETLQSDGARPYEVVLEGNNGNASHSC